MGLEQTRFDNNCGTQKSWGREQAAQFLSCVNTNVHDASNPDA